RSQDSSERDLAMAKKTNKEPAAAKDEQASETSEAPEEQLAMLLHDLQELSAYLTERGRHTYELAQRFMEHARQDRDPSTRAYDERQATMLGYQRHVWVEIAGLVNKLLVQYDTVDDEENRQDEVNRQE